MTRALFCLAIAALSARAEILDRVAIVIGTQVITELQLDEELRIEAFLNRAPVVRDLAARRAAADRLIQQVLVKREMGLSHYPAPSDSDIQEYEGQVRAQFGAVSAFNKAIAEYQLSLPTVTEHLVTQLMTMRFIEFRFRPDVDIPEADVEARYAQEVASWKRQHEGQAPALSALRESISKELVEERVDAALGSWLEETRKQVNIVYIDKSLI